MNAMLLNLAVITVFNLEVQQIRFHYVDLFNLKNLLLDILELHKIIFKFRISSIYPQ